MTTIKTTEIPSHAKHLYIKLYCEKKGGMSNENIHDASQSWLSLSLPKKQRFYDTVSTKSAIKKAQRIIQTEPFLRAKFPSHAKHHKQKNAKSTEHYGDSDNLLTSVHDDTVMECDSTRNSFQQDNVDGTLAETTELEADNNALQEQAEECELQRMQSEALPITSHLEAHNTLQERLEDSALEQTQNEADVCDVQNLQKSHMSVIDEDTASETETIEKAAESIPLSEPVLPIIKTGRELFELLKARNGGTRSYESLTNPEKRFYGNAFCAIRKDYVQKYKEYLESLSPRQLFDYYTKIFQ